MNGKKEKKRAERLEAVGLQVPSPRPEVYPHPISPLFAQMYEQRSQRQGVQSQLTGETQK